MRRSGRAAWSSSGRRSPGARSRTAPSSSCSTGSITGAPRPRSADASRRSNKSMTSKPLLTIVCSSLVVAGLAAGPQKPATPAKGTTVSSNPKLDALKKDAAADIDSMREFTQQMVDQVFSYGELGFQEVETSKYLTAILEKNGFTVERGIAGIPTAWLATWGNGKPVIAIGSDIDGIPQASQKPGVAYHDPIIEGAPGHGEGHNSGQAVNIT